MIDKGLSNNTYNSLLIHTGQGFQYQNVSFITYLKSKNIVQSVSRKGNCYDNAMSKNFFSHLKAEFYEVNKFKTVKEFGKKLEEYIEYYNTKRIVMKLKMPRYNIESIV